MHAASGDRLAVRVGHDRRGSASASRPCRRRRRPNRSPRRREAQERRGVGDREIRNVASPPCPPCTSSETADPAEPARRATRPPARRAECPSASTSVSNDGVCLGPEPLRPEPVIVPSVGRNRRALRASRRRARAPPCSGAPKRYAALADRAHARAGRRRGLARARVSSLKFGGLNSATRKAPLIIVAARPLRFDRVISERLLRRKRHRQREHAVRVGLHGPEATSSCRLDLEIVT